MTICPCGRTMSTTGTGSRHVDGEQDAIHTQSYRCGSCGFTDFAPRMHGDPTREEAYAAYVAITHTMGTIRHLHTGRVVGKTASLEQTFIEHVRSLEGDCYVVVPRAYDAYLGAAIRELGVPVIVEDDPELTTAYVFSGTPDEWHAAREA